MVSSEPIRFGRILDALRFALIGAADLIFRVNVLFAFLAMAIFSPLTMMF